MVQSVLRFFLSVGQGGRFQLIHFFVAELIAVFVGRIYAFRSKVKVGILIGVQSVLVLLIIILDILIRDVQAIIIIGIVGIGYSGLGENGLQGASGHKPTVLDLEECAIAVSIRRGGFLDRIHLLLDRFGNIIVRIAIFYCQVI